MKLIMTKEQEELLNRRGFLKSDELKRAFELSCKDQEKLRRQAERYRSWRRRSIKLRLYPCLKFLQRYYKKLFRPKYWL